MKPLMNSISITKIMKLWESQSLSMLTSTLIIWRKPLKIMSCLNSEELLLSSTERMANSTNPSTFPKRMRCIEMLLRQLKKQTMPRLSKIYWSSSWKRKRSNSLLPLSILATITWDLIWSSSMPGDSECMNSVCPIWFSWSLSWRPGLRQSTERTKTERKRKRPKLKRKWISH